MEIFWLSAIAIFTVGFLLMKKKRKNGCDLLPPGNLGQPLVGETIRFLQAFKRNKIDEFLRQRVMAYGPVFKTCLFGQPTVVMTGPAGNRFWLVNDGKLFHGNARGPHRAIIGRNSLLDKNGEEHRLVRAALMTFFSPDSLKKLVGKMDSAIRRHLDEYWDGKETVHAVHLMKFTAFSVTCDVLFNVQDKFQVEELCELFKVATDGIYSFPVRFPGSRLNRALKARSQIDRILSEMIMRRKNDLKSGGPSARQDLISALLSLTKKDGKVLSDQELKDNIVLLVIAGHETTAMTLALMCKLLAENPLCFDRIDKEAADIGVGEQLTWEDVQRMKYLWSVAQETLRFIPPISGIFRRATADIQYGRYTIPKGWAMYWSNYSTVYREDLFPEAHKFDPSRFQGSGGIRPYSFLPFGGGLRMCPGNEYAKLEIVITMHHLVKRYRWSAQIPDEPIIRNPLCVPAMGLPLKLTPVLNN
ncbi:hypothetical protein SUGI_0416190 [Cryptomeria japonica]|uniref:taxadiene 5-alpha hydroxylase n=1 Tax=Cryptomeria japonica TaxID=3369 RepID=UPI002408D7DA|nr:taxadiene 5-alpha hydroxylase [Cryptomeria japonica]GLJ22154.1 hypothetical protein SUGI_0416190 [Cryptomeria japonica]